MTKQELLALPHIESVIEKRLLRLKIETGYRICNYVEGMDMEEYFSTNDMFLPVKDEYEQLTIVSDEEDAQHYAEAEAARQNLEEEEDE